MSKALLDARAWFFREDLVKLLTDFLMQCAASTSSVPQGLDTIAGPSVRSLLAATARRSCSCMASLARVLRDRHFSLMSAAAVFRVSASSCSCSLARRVASALLLPPVYY